MHKRPEYYIVGTAKAGTTSIFKVLLQHPHIFVPEKKETYFFGEHFYRDAKVETLDEYRKIFSKAPRDCVTLEVSTSYLYSRKAASEIKAYNADAKIIIILRNPVDRAYSNYLYKLKTGKEPVYEFQKALEAEESRIREGWPYGFHYTRMGLYCEQVKRYLETFDARNILILLFDELKKDKRSFYDGLFRFLDIEFDAECIPKKVYNKSGLFRSKHMMRLLNTENLVRRVGRSIVPVGKRRHVAGWLRDVNIRNSKPAMNNETREGLVRHFHQDILKLQEVIGIDLSHWLVDHGLSG